MPRDRLQLTQPPSCMLRSFLFLYVSDNDPGTQMYMWLLSKVHVPELRCVNHKHLISLVLCRHCLSGQGL